MSWLLLDVLAMLTLAPRSPGRSSTSPEVALEVIVITAGCPAAAGLVTVAAVVAVRLRRRHLPARPQPASSCNSSLKLEPRGFYGAIYSTFYCS